MKRYLELRGPPELECCHQMLFCIIAKTAILGGSHTLLQSVYFKSCWKCNWIKGSLWNYVNFSKWKQQLKKTKARGFSNWGKNDQCIIIGSICKKTRDVFMGLVLWSTRQNLSGKFIFLFSYLFSAAAAAAIMGWWNSLEIWSVRGEWGLKEDEGLGNGRWAVTALYSLVTNLCLSPGDSVCPGGSHWQVQAFV